MGRRLLLVAPKLVAVLVVGAIGLALIACGGGGEARGQEDEANKPRPLPENNVTLRPGEYRSVAFEPSFSFRVGEGWKHVAPELPDKLAISPGGEPGDPLLIFRNLQKVYKPAKSMDSPPVVEAPKDMVGWFQNHPYLKTEKPRPVTVGGVEGEQFDWVVAEDAPYAEVDTFKYSDGSDAASVKGFKFRAIVLEDVKGETVTIGIGSKASEFDEFLPEAQKVLETVKWGGGGGSAQEEQADKEQADKVRNIPEDSQTYEGEPLPAGRYVTEEFEPAMSFMLSKGWTRGGTEGPDIWDLRDLENDAYWVVFSSAKEVYDPKGPDRVKIVPAPEDMVAWLQENPHLKADEPKPTSVGGEKGVQFDAIVTGAVETPLCPGCVDLSLFRNSDGETMGVENGEKIRFIVVDDVKGKTVTMFVETTPQDFEEFMPKAQKVVDSVKWGGS